MITILIEIGEVIVSLGAWVARLFPFIGRFLGRFWGWILSLSPWLKDFFATRIAKAGKAIYDTALMAAMETMVMVAWSWLLSFATSYFSHTGLITVLNKDPFAGLPRDAMALVAAAFPVHFAVGLITGYALFRVTLPTVAQYMIRVIRWIFGA